MNAEKSLLPLLDEYPQPAARATTYRALAWIKFHQQQYQQARTFLDKSYSAEPKAPETLLLLGLTYLAEKRPDVGLKEVQSNSRSAR